MTQIEFTTPWPPSVNQLYATASTPTYSAKKDKFYYERHLSIKGRQFKKYVVDLLCYTLPRVKYGPTPVYIHIRYNLPDDNRVRDVHNLEKILFDSIEASGIIDNDKQIVSWKVVPGQKMGKGELHVMMRPYDVNKEEKQ